MSQKRLQPDEGTTSFDDKRQRKFPTFKSVVLDVMNLQRLQNLMEPVLEPLIRRVVKEEVDSALRKYIISMKKNCGKNIHPSESKSLKLEFLNSISLPVFSGSRIEGEGCTNMEVALVDAQTSQVVSNEIGSSGKVEIVALEGDFGGYEGEKWPLEDFTNNIVRAREGKKPLLTGDVIVTLKEGTGLVGDISFTDNSSWTRSRKFRLGARLVDDLAGVRVREARSEAFVVKDHRGELYKKHHPPSLSDEVWRLEKIGKDGAFHKRLREERVKTVQDFLMLFNLNPIRLRNILGTGMSGKMWEVTVEHARTCVLDNKLYLYNASSSLQKEGVVFNSVGQVMGMFSDGQYVPADQLSEAEKAVAGELVISAYGDSNNIITLDDEFSLNMLTPPCFSDTQPSSSKLADFGSHQDLSTQKIPRFTHSQEDTSSPNYMNSVYPAGSLNNLDDYFHGVDPMEIRYDQALSFPAQVAEICDTDSMTQAFTASERLQYFEASDLELPADLQNAVDAFVPCMVDPVDKAPKWWNILVSVLRWRFSIKRIVARKTQFEK